MFSLAKSDGLSYIVSDGMQQGREQMPFQDHDANEREAKVVHEKRDATRPWMVLKPRGYLHRLLNHYETEAKAKRACNRWNKQNA